jgi:uncharacterized protein YjdB
VTASVVVAGTQSIDVGGTTHLTASALTSTGTPITGKTFTWSSSNNAVATVTSDGTVTGVSAGTAAISAAAEGVSGQLSVTINSPALVVATVTVSGASSVTAGQTTKLTAAATTATGVAVTGRNVTWSSNATGVASVSSDGTVTGVSAGSAIISATIDGVVGTRTLTVIVTPPVVANVTVSGNAAVQVGRTIALSAAATDAAGVAIAGKTFTWTTSSTATATVDGNGVVTGIAPGTATISAAVDGKTGSKVVTVSTATSGAQSITIAGPFTGQAGTTTQLTAVVKDANGGVIPDAIVTWSSSDTVNVPISATGLVTAVHIANANITASSGNATANAPFSSSLSPYTFSFPPAMSATEQQMIKDNVQAAHALHKTVFNRQIQNSTVISALGVQGTCANGGAAAATTSGSLVICFQNPGWLQPSAVLKKKIVQHELFHVWQWENHWLNNNPALVGAYWIAEGSAELMGFKGVDATGALPFATGVGCNVKESSDFALSHPPGLPALSSVETAQTFNGVQGPIYTTSMLGMNELTTQNGLASLKTYADAIAAGTEWHTAFQTAFGVSTTAFYSGFPAYYASLPVPATYQCNF